MTSVQGQQRIGPAELEACLRAIGPERYHHRHPFHLLMHEGKLTRGQLQAWALNRYYYQSIIPLKDAIIVSRSEDAAFRRAWRKRIIDHDGDGIHPGGIETWFNASLLLNCAIRRTHAARRIHMSPRRTRSLCLTPISHVSVAPIITVLPQLSVPIPVEITR